MRQASPWCNKLNAIPDGALPDMGELHRLDLSHNRIAAVTMAKIAAGPQTKLKCLQLHHNPVAKADTAAFAMLGGSAGHMNALDNWPAGDEDGSLCCTLDKGVFDAAVGIQISNCKCPGGGNPVFCGGSTTIACAESCDPTNDNAAVTTRLAATKGGSTFQSGNSGSGRRRRVAALHARQGCLCCRHRDPNQQVQMPRRRQPGVLRRQHHHRLRRNL